ncbi:hypothetical protein RhiirC2_853078 [Rhizophagus irregularis]|uniref:RNI-like protein n=1 Tax=Rhizophagus irregularis TaxID=588596 RepID=A0A2N1MWX7_9GLOM|nr:hypothetical protein RhiirC2_853078 [Rhizophagus irregularis]
MIPIPSIPSNTPSRVHITIYQDDAPSSRKSNKRILSDEMDVTPHSRKTMRNRSPSQSRTPMNSLRISGKPRVPFYDKVNLTPYNPHKALINKSKSTSTPKTAKTVTFSDSHTTYENEVTSANKKFKNESGQVVNIDSYRRRIEQLEAELRNQIDENQKQTEEVQKYRQEIERALERAKYVALGYKNELYGPVYIDGDHNSINKLLRHLAKVVGQDVISRFREETLVDDELPALNQIIAWFEESGFLKYEVLKEFRAAKMILSLDLTYTFENVKRDNNNIFIKKNLKPIEIEPQKLNHHMQNANRLVSVFGLPNGFRYLKALKLSNMPIKDSYFNNFRGLSLNELVIDNTGIGDEALAYLVALKDNLCLLNITGNMKITDDSIFILVLFEKLMVLLLDDTSISMDGVRKFVSMTASIELSQISIPSSCRKYLNKRKEIYCVEHKQGMKVDPLEVKFMSLSEIRRQLMFHYEVNSNINIVGSKEELEELLREILKRRRDDGKAMLLTGGRD